MEENYSKCSAHIKAIVDCYIAANAFERIKIENAIKTLLLMLEQIEESGRS